MGVGVGVHFEFIESKTSWRCFEIGQPLLWKELGGMGLPGRLGIGWILMPCAYRV